MKHIISGLSLVVLILFLFSCHDEEAGLSPDKGKVTFLPYLVNLGRVEETAKPAFVMVSIKDAQGNERKNVKLTLTGLGQNYVSENLELEIGNYQLTQFQVLDAGNRPIYATPLEGSKMAEYVADPLSIDFTVTTEDVQINPEVLAIAEENATSGLSILQIPLTGVEEVTKVTYQFKNGTRTITSEAAPTVGMLTIYEPDLLYNVWEMTIIVWTRQASPGQQYTKVYRYPVGKQEFGGPVVRLPVLTKSQYWAPFYYSYFPQHHNVELLVPVDPRDLFQVEVITQEPFECSLDRTYYNANGQQVCDPMVEEKIAIAKDGNWVCVPYVDNQKNCDMSSLSHIYVGSVVSMKFDEDPNLLKFPLKWEIVDGKVTSYSMP